MNLFAWRVTKRAGSVHEVSPDEILLDARNLPEFHAGRLEGRMNRPVSGGAYTALVVLLCLTGVVFLGQCARLMVVEGRSYAALSQNNRLAQATVIAERGVVYDRNGEILAHNEPFVRDGTEETFSTRVYTNATGSAHVLGYIRLPQRDASGLLYSTASVGVAGIEHAYDAQLRGENGQRIVETDARQDVVGGGVLVRPRPGDAITLTIDARLQALLHRSIQELADRIPFDGGAGVILDVRSGQVLAMTSYPEYDPNVLVQGDTERIAGYAAHERTPYLNRAVSGQYTPGSIVKPYIAAAALSEGVVRPDTTFVSTGALYVPNPYNPGTPSVFTDWRAHGRVDVRRALAVSSNVYFYYVGGGFGDQAGLGITRIDDYVGRFGFGDETGIDVDGELPGIVPSPAWKDEKFEDGTWRLGDTYNTAIGQYGWQVTPLQAVRAIAAVANGGTLVTPYLYMNSRPIHTDTGVDDSVLQIVREGMRQGAIQGTAVGLNTPYVEIAAKTGTAELGARKEYVHSWVTGFWPYEDPKYAFAILMEKGPRANLYGATGAARAFFDALHRELPEYLEP